MNGVLTIFFLLPITIIYCQSNKKPLKYNQTDPASKFHNPNFIRDRDRNTIVKQEMPESWVKRFRQPFDPAWMDYCDPWHCNDYHKQACGLNRDSMRFKWFQSGCHLILNNQCAAYRGFLRYDVVSPQFCNIYVMYLRVGCPSSCNNDGLDPKCGLNLNTGSVVLFRNQCSMDAYNCRNSGLEEYDVVDMAMCEYYIQHA